jgi:LysM repeat protein
MNTSNPFQLPSCLQRADLEQRRQKRFQKIVVTVIAGSAALLVVLLIEGCMSEHANAAATMPAIAEKPQTVVAVTEQKPATLPLTPVASASTAAPVASKQNLVSTTVASSAVYVVRPGDTLTRIAKLYRITIKALKEANSLNSDTLAVGAKLKVPTA